MAEYIERDKALNVCEMHYKHCISMQDWRGDTIAWNIGADIKTIPSADVVEVKHGYWQVLVFKGGRRSGRVEAKCSICGRDAVYQITEDKWEFENYCPHCGAKMDGDSNV